jgi:hypothetical protein
VTRYVVGRIRAGKPLYIETPLWDDNEPHRPSLTVDDHEAADTGLITATGEPIFRLPEPMGFHKPDGVRD